MSDGMILSTEFETNTRFLTFDILGILRYFIADILLESDIISRNLE